MSIFASKIKTNIEKYASGLLVAFTIAAAARFMSEHYAAPVMLFALLIGMAFNFLYEDKRCEAGIELASKSLLKIGVALLGVRVTLDQISTLGWTPILMVISLIVATIVASITLSRLFSKSTEFGILTGVAVAICGASAALAISSVLPKSEEARRNTLFTVACVTALSTLAMVVYPIVFQTMGFSDTSIGVLLGATIHDVAQVIGAGFAVSDEAGEIATYVKLLRVACLPVVILVFAWIMQNKNGAEAKSSFPWFAVGFVVILLGNSAGLFPKILAAFMDWSSQWLLIGAISALGVKTSLKSMVALGPAHLGLVVAETVFLCGLAIIAVFLIQS